MTFKVGVTLPMHELESGRLATLAELGRYAQRAEALGFDSVWTMDHIWIERGGRKVGGHHPLVVLAFLASLTTRIQLGTLVICNSFRSPVELGRQAAAIADASRGRFVLGLGPGWHRPEYDACGLPFDHKVGRMAETLDVLPALLAGRPVAYEGRFLAIPEGELLVSAPAPPIWLAARGARTLELAARHADGWNSAWHGPDPAAFAAEADRLQTLLNAAGRPKAAVEFSAGILALPCGEEESEDLLARASRLASPGPNGAPPDLTKLVVTGGPAQLAAVLNAYQAVGADHVVLGLSTSPFALLEAALLDRAAESLPLLAANGVAQ